MSPPRLLSDILLDIAADPNEPMGAILRQCPFVQAELIRRKKMSLDDLTDEQIDWLIDWDQKEGGVRIDDYPGIHRPRTKFLDVQKANLRHRKQRKHSRSQTRKITRRLLDLLGKILKEIREIERGNENAESLLTVREKSDLEIITRMYRQQKNHFRNNDSRESIPNRIVSLSKPHLRPIVRGKEEKSVEFGAKVNNILVDGISFIEKLSFNAFNEGTRLVHCLKMHKRLFGVEAKKVGGDTGYAGTENRDYCKANGIQTSFVKRGRPFGEKKKEKDLVRKELARVRATAMEGSFGTQKEHYDLRRVKARTKRTEILYIFFGIHTANVVQLADRIEQRARLVAA